MQDPGAMNRDRADRTTVDVEPFEAKSPDLEGGDTSMDPEDMSLEDRVEAEGSRPTLDDENADGLDEMGAEIQHQAEDLPSHPPGRR